MKKRAAFIAALTLLLGTAIASESSAQESPSLYEYARPALDWYTIETEHFSIVFHADEEGRGSSRSAQVVARIAEEVYGPITQLYDREPNSRVHIILKDYEDYSNGAAYFFDNKIEIWAPALDSPLRGDHDWLRNVIAHEFTHIVQVQTTMKAPRSLPLAYLQILDYETVRRPDVLYGYPNVIISYPVASLNNPAWFAEGTAQYQRSWLEYDQWDTHRDMMLRTRVQAGQTLSLKEMGGFYSKSSLMREGVYNHGYAFTRYLAQTYGEEVLRDVSQALGKWSNWNVERALRDALGARASVIYGGWMRAMTRAYEEGTRQVREHLVEGQLVEPQGHANYHPDFSPDGSRLAYVSSGIKHFGETSLYVRDLSQGDIVEYDLGGATPGYTCAFGHRLRRGVGGAVSWRPDGEAIVYARRRQTSEGYLYADLYELELESRKEKRLTHARRAAHPAYAPNANSIVYVTQEDGSTNLATLDLNSGETRELTAYVDGSQVYDPAWHPSGHWVYFSRLAPQAHGRDILRVRSDGSALEAVVATEADERSPVVGPDAVYYSSDVTGIYNLYRLGDAGPERLTNVLGGAFMPTVRTDGALAYAHYQWDGYKIALLSTPQPMKGEATYEPPAMLQKQATPGAASLAAYDDTDIAGLDGADMAILRREGNLAVATDRGDSVRVTRYGSAFTGFSIFPVVRFDHYVSRRRDHLDARLPDRTRAQSLVRNFKFGAYASSREILEGLSLFGGLLIGPGSRPAGSVTDFLSPVNLLSLERDAFLVFDYKKGLRILPLRWSPQFSLEFFNIRRRVERGLSVEEFPCTACFPDTTLIDLTYALWEGDILARSKVSQYLLLELGYRYSPYRVITEQFFSQELQLTIPESSSRYFIGRTFMAKAYLEAFAVHREADVFPIGLKLDVGYERELGRLLRRFDIREGILTPLYGSERIHRLTLDGQFGARLPGSVRGAAHGVALSIHASGILGPKVDGFYNDYVGGLSGARGYPFYALGGNETLWMQASYYMPLFPDVRKQLLFTYIDKAYLRFYADAAAVWPGTGALRKDVGAELRLKLGSYYLFPTAVFVSATYGMDAFDFRLDEGFVTPSGRRSVRYGADFQWHFGVLFGFDV